MNDENRKQSASDFRKKREHCTANTSGADKTLAKNMCLRSKYHNKKARMPIYITQTTTYKKKSHNNHSSPR